MIAYNGSRGSVNRGRSKTTNQATPNLRPNKRRASKSRSPNPQGHGSSRTAFEATKRKPKTAKIQQKWRPVSNFQKTRTKGGQIGSYTVMTELGKGNFGRVYQAYHTQTKQVRAVKALIDSKMNQTMVKEIDLMRSLPAHDNIVRYIEHFETRDGRRTWTNVVFEFIGMGSLLSLLETVGSLSEWNVGRMTQDILHGLEFLHAQGLIHLDIKPANVLITNECVVKIADFGSAVREADECDVRPGGSRAYAPPETAIDGAKISTAFDIWSVGSTAIHLFTGAVPECEDGEAPKFPDGDQTVGASRYFIKFLERCFKEDANARPSASALLDDRWFRMLTGRRAATFQQRMSLEQARAESKEDAADEEPPQNDFQTCQRVLREIEEQCSLPPGGSETLLSAIKIVQAYVEQQNADEKDGEQDEDGEQDDQNNELIKTMDTDMEKMFMDLDIQDRESADSTSSDSAAADGQAEQKNSTPKKKKRNVNKEKAKHGNERKKSKKAGCVLKKNAQPHIRQCAMSLFGATAPKHRNAQKKTLNKSGSKTRATRHHKQLSWRKKQPWEK